jgi:hypothetical protein
MIRRTKDGYSMLLAVSALLLAAPAFSQAAPAAPAAQGKAADKSGAKPADKAGKEEGKSEGNPGKPAANPGKTVVANPGKPEEKPGDQTVAAAVQKKEADEAKIKARLQRRTSEQEAERPKIMAALKGQPMTEAMRQELSRHARRLARLERVKALALEAKDDATLQRVAKLIDMENARHDKFAVNLQAKDDKAGAK